MRLNIINKIVWVLLSVVSILMLSSCMEPDYTELIDEHKHLAGELKDNKLYNAAVEEYKKILEFKSIDFKTRANINYLIAKIYFENIKDYENAASYYIRAQSLNPEGSFKNEASKNVVASFEKMGNLLDARRKLRALTDIDSKSKKEGDVEVARIGNEPVWLSEIDQQIQSMPLDQQNKFRSKEAKLKFVQQYIGVELMYRSAVRENYGDDPEIKKRQQQMLRQLIVDKYIVDKVMPQIKIDSMDVRYFYQANAADRYDNKPYDSVKAQVFMDYQNEKASQTFNDYINKLSQKEKVQILEHNIR